jgi:hypothetical protein
MALVPFTAATNFDLVNIEGTTYIRVIAYALYSGKAATGIMPVYDFSGNLKYGHLISGTNWHRGRGGLLSGTSQTTTVNNNESRIYIQSGFTPNYALTVASKFQTITKTSEQLLRITYEFRTKNANFGDVFMKIADGEYEAPVYQTPDEDPEPEVNIAEEGETIPVEPEEEP